MGSALSGQVCCTPNAQRPPSQHTSSWPPQHHISPATHRHQVLDWPLHQQRHRKENRAPVSTSKVPPKRATLMPVRAGFDSTAHTWRDNESSRRGHHSATIPANTKLKRPRQTHGPRPLARVEEGFERSDGRWQFYRHFTYRALGRESPVSSQRNSSRSASRRPASHPSMHTAVGEQHQLLVSPRYHHNPHHGRKPSRHHQYDYLYHGAAGNERVRPMTLHRTSLRNPQPTRKQSPPDRRSPQEYYYLEEVDSASNGAASYDWPMYQLFQAGTSDARHDNKQQNKRH